MKSLKNKLRRFIKSVKECRVNEDVYEELKDTALVKALDNVFKCYGLFYWTESNLLNAECEGVEIPHNAWGHIVGLMEEANLELAKVLLVEPSMVMDLYTDYPNIYDNCRDGFGWIDKGLFKDYYIPKYIIEGFVNALDKLKDELLKVGYYG